jgi:hypothetical protein
MVTGSAFAKADKSAIEGHTLFLISDTQFTLTPDAGMRQSGRFSECEKHTIPGSLIPLRNLTAAVNQECV